MNPRTMLRTLATALAFGLLLAHATAAQIPALPEGAQSQWVVRQPEEIVTYLTFDPARVQRELPRELRFITVGELAGSGVRWASEYLRAHAAHRRWGVAFLEIVRAGTFEIDGRAPVWPEQGAAALWCARVAPVENATDLGEGRPLLVLGFWIPDSAYAAYMRTKGHFATYGDVRLTPGASGRWLGSVQAEGLNIVAQATPHGAISGGSGSAGTQAFFAPRSSGMKHVVRVAFAGHRTQECSAGSTWRIRGKHPLASAIVVPPTTFQFGYELSGGAYGMSAR